MAASASILGDAIFAVKHVCDISHLGRVVTRLIFGIDGRVVRRQALPGLDRCPGGLDAYPRRLSGRRRPLAEAGCILPGIGGLSRAPLRSPAALGMAARRTEDAEAGALD